MKVKKLKLEQITTKIGSGKTPLGGDSVYSEAGTPFIRSQNVYNLSFKYDGLTYVDDKIASQMKNVEVQKDDVLLNITGDSVARCTIVPEDVIPARVNQHVCIIRGKPEVIDQNYLSYYLVSPYMQKHMLSIAGFGGTRKALSKQLIDKFEIPVPDLSIQKKIVEVVKNYGRLIDVNSKRISLLEESARLIFKEWFVNLRFPGYEKARIVNGLPNGWKACILEDLLILQRGFDLPSEKREEGDIPIYASTGINGYHSRAAVPGPGVITGRSGTLGKVTYAATDYWPLNTALWVKEFKKVSPIYAIFLLRYLRLDKYNGGVSVPTLDRKVVHKIKTVCPPQEQIVKFDETVSPIFSLIECLTKQNAKLEEARSLLLPRLLNGDIEL